MAASLVKLAAMSPAMRFFLAVGALAYIAAFVHFALWGEINAALPGGIRVVMRDWKSPLLQFAVIYGALAFSFASGSADRLKRFTVMSWAAAVVAMMFVLIATSLGAAMPPDKSTPILIYQPQFVYTALWLGAIYLVLLSAPFIAAPDMLDVGKRPLTASLTLVFAPCLILYLSNGYSVFGGDTTWNTLLPQYLLSGGAIPFPPEVVEKRGMFGLMESGSGYLPIHPVGATFFAFPAALAQMALGVEFGDTSAGWGQKVTSAWVAAGSAAMLFQWVYLMTKSRWITWTMTIAYAVGSPQAIFSSVTLWQHGPAAFLINLGLLFIIKGGLEKNSRLLSLSALPLAFLPMIRPHTIVFYFAAMAVAAMTNRKTVPRFIAWSLFGAGAALAINLGLYHNILGGYIHLANEGGFNAPLFKGLAGLFISANRGLFIFSPFLLLAIPGLYLAVARRDLTGIVFAVGAIVYLSIHATWVVWYAGWATGPRFTVETVPVLIYLCALFLVEARAALVKYTATALVALSIAVTAPGMYYPHENTQWNVFPDIDSEKNEGRLWSFNEWLPFHFMNRVWFEKGVEVPCSWLVWDKGYDWIERPDGAGYRVRLDINAGRLGAGIRSAQSWMKKGDYVFTLDGESVNAADGKIIGVFHEFGKRVTKKEMAIPSTGRFTLKETVSMMDDGWLQIEIDAAGAGGEAILDTIQLVRK